MSALNDVLSITDVLYLTRYGGENFTLSKSNIKYLKESAIVLHPLPKDGEISSLLKYHKINQLKYLRQVENSIYIRSAILIEKLGISYV